MTRLVSIMRYIARLAVFSIGLASTILADESNPTNATEPSAVSLGVIQATDISHVQLGQGQPLPPGQTTYFLHIVRLELYRMTVQARGDVDLAGVRTFRYDKVDANLKLDIKPFTNRIPMTLGTSFYGVWELVGSMLHPVHQGDGFFETNWMISKKGVVGRIVPMGYIAIADAGTLPKVASNSSTPAPLLEATLPSSDPSAPFPIPDTHITLLIGPRGAALDSAEVILILNGLLNLAWQDVAVYHRVRPVPETNSRSHQPGGVVAALRPRMNGGRSQVTSTDLAEAVTGMVYYFLAARAAFATTVTVAKPNGAGRRVPIGSIEIQVGQPRVEMGSSANDTLVETS